MSKPRLTKEQKKVRKELIKRYRADEKAEEGSKCKLGFFAALVALATLDLLKGKD